MRRWKDGGKKEGERERKGGGSVSQPIGNAVSNRERERENYK